MIQNYVDEACTVTAKGKNLMSNFHEGAVVKEWPNALRMLASHGVRRVVCIVYVK